MSEKVTIKIRVPEKIRFSKILAEVDGLERRLKRIFSILPNYVYDVGITRELIAESEIVIAIEGKSRTALDAVYDLILGYCTKYRITTDVVR